MNIIYVEPNFRKRKIYPYYAGLYEELVGISNCYLYQKNIGHISEVLKKCPFKPDAIIFGLGWFKTGNYEKIKGLKKLDIPTICYLFKPQNNLSQKLNFCQINRFDMILTPVPSYKDFERQTGIPTRLFKYGSNPRIFKDWKESKIYDFGFSGALHDYKHYIDGAFSTENIRSRIHTLLKKRKDLNCFLNGSDTMVPRIKNHQKYAKVINMSKIWLSTPAAFKDMTPRYLEIGMSRTLIFCDSIPVEYQDTFINGVNCVVFLDDLSDFEDKLDYYLRNDEERKIITDNAYNDFHGNHTWKKRAEELISIIKEIKK